MTPEEYNSNRIRDGLLKATDLTKLIKIAQEKLRVFADGYVGPVTVEALNAPTAEGSLWIDEKGWLHGPKVMHMPLHASWYGKEWASKVPLGLVWHTSDTDPGTAVNMAKRRQVAVGVDPDTRLGSWHASIEADGTIVQMVSFNVNAYHAASPSARKTAVGWANYTCLGVEIISPDDKNFPSAQVQAAEELARAVVQTYHIQRDHMQITHASIDPERRSDPGKEWVTTHMQPVMEYAFA